MRRRLRSALGLAGCAVLLAGCAAASDSDSETAVHEIYDVASAPLWSVDATPVGTEGAVIDDTVIAYLSNGDDGVTLTAFDADDGARLWSRPASINNGSLPSDSLFPNVGHSDSGQSFVAVIGEPRDGGGGWYQNGVSLVDPRTGEDLISVTEGWVNRLWDCGLTDGYCYRYYPAGSDDWANYAITLTGISTFAEESPIAQYEDFALVGDGVWKVQEGDASFLARVIDGEERWRVSGAEIGTTSVMDAVSSWYTYPDEGMVLFATTGSARGEAKTIAADEFTYGAIDIDTGQVLWTVEGGLWCFNRAESPAVCSGEFDIVFEGTGPAEFSYGTVTLTGVDPQTGEPRWERDIPGFGGLSNYGGGSDLLPAGEWWPIETEDGLILINSRTGDTQALEDGGLVGCWLPISIEVHENSIPSNELVPVERGRYLRGCSATGATTNARQFTEAVVSGGAFEVMVNGEWIDAEELPIRVVQTLGEVVAFPPA